MNEAQLAKVEEYLNEQQRFVEKGDVPLQLCIAGAVEVLKVLGYEVKELKRFAVVKSEVRK